MLHQLFREEPDIMKALPLTGTTNAQRFNNKDAQGPPGATN